MKISSLLSTLMAGGMMFCLGGSAAKAQIIYLSEDFEGAPITTITNVGDATLTLGASPCGKGSRGDVTIFNSTHVDFQALQNQTRYLAVNPESPCGGFYTANLNSDTMDLSSSDSLVFSCRYFKSNTLGWGPTSLILTFDNGSTTYILNSEFTAVNTWTDFTIGLPASMQASSVVMLITMGGGEGVALDNIQVKEFSGVGVEETGTAPQWQVYPNPAADIVKITGGNALQRIDLVDMNGKTVQSVMPHSDAVMLDVSGLRAGIYLLRSEDIHGTISFRKLLIRR